MLLEFRVKNFKSIKDECCLSMVASKDKTHEERLLPVDDKTKALPVAVIYGANASGKSNVIEAYNIFCNLVRDSATRVTSDSKIPRVPFKLDDRCLTEPSEFGMDFLLEKIRYSYEFSVTGERVIHERLISYPKGQPRRLFERKWKKKTKSYEYKFHASWKGEKKKFQEMTRDNALFLSVSAQFNHWLATELVKFITDGSNFNLKSIYNDEQIIQMQFTNYFSKNYEEFKKSICKMLIQSDFGIHDFSVVKLPKEESPFWPLLKDNFEDRESDKLDLTLHVKTKHIKKSIDGHEKLVEFEMREESDGTQRFYTLAGFIVMALLSGMILVADELDLRLHPLLTKTIIKKFLDPKINTKGAQLIFATHDVGLLEDKNLFRRDQIWFTEKDRFGATDLYSLWDFDEKPRRDENIRKGYLAGRYGAIPILEDPE